MKTGRPTKYSKEIADKICEIISTSTKGLNAICKDGGFPVPSTIYLWLINNKEFSENYARAKEMQADFMMEEIIVIADDDSGDIIQGTESSYANGVSVQRAKLRTEVRKFAASKMAPKKYGDKLDVTSDGEKIPAPIIMLTDTDGDKA